MRLLDAHMRPWMSQKYHRPACLLTLFAHISILAAPAGLTIY